MGVLQLSDERLTASEIRKWIANSFSFPRVDGNSVNDLNVGDNRSSFWSARNENSHGSSLKIKDSSADARLSEIDSKYFGL